MSPFVPEVNADLAYGLHQVAIHRSETGLKRSYGTEDARLRRTAHGLLGHRLPAPEGLSLNGVLRGEPIDAADRPWFDLRWEQGEREGITATVTRLCEEANALPIASHFAHQRIRISASVCVGDMGLAHPNGWWVTCGLKTSTPMLVLQGIASGLYPLLTTHGVPSEMRAFLALQVAGSVLVHHTSTTGNALDAYLKAAVDVLKPAPGAGGKLDDHIRAIAELLLDQPPGEIDRIASGLCAGRSDRLHRAWQRGFFVPATLDLKAWSEESLA